MVWGRWERRKRNHLWKDDTLKSIKILISMILSIIYSSCFSLLCSFMYLFTVFTSPAREGDRQRFGQITFKLRVATKCDHQQPGLWQNLHLPINQLRPKKWKPIGRRKNHKLETMYDLLSYEFPFISINFAHVTLFMLAFRVFLHITPLEIFSSD